MAASASAPAQTSAGVIPGIEVLLTDSVHLIQGKRVGLLTNHSGRDRKGVSDIDRLFKAPGVKLTALFGPEHGIRGVAKAGAKMGNSVDSATGVKVYSLYGETPVPTQAMLDEIDVLLYDIQDVGARVYTYQWTHANAAAVAKKPIVILDRPDPIRADRVEGNILDTAFKSLVGQHPVALRYGLTPGELLKFLVGLKYIDADVKVVPMKNYTRAMWYDQTGIPRVNPSPNLRNLNAELLYTGTVFFEGTSVAEGRGTDDPFAQVGATWLTDNVAIAAEMNAMKLPGLRFDTVTRRVEKEFRWRTPQIDRLGGTDQLRKAVEGNTVDALIKQWDADAAKFAQQVKPYLIYK